MARPQGLDGIRIERAERADLPGLLAVQKRAFAHTAALYDLAPEYFPPLGEGSNDVEASYDDGEVALKASTSDGVIVGGIRADVTASTAEITRLMVDDGFTGQGVGAALMQALEAAVPAKVTRIDLFTGERNVGAIGLYERMGYSTTRTEEFEPGVVFVFMAKSIGAPGPT